METLGERIRFARSAARKTQQEVADHFRIKRVNVTQWESNTTKPDISRLPELAGLLNTSVEWLLDATGTPPASNQLLPRAGSGSGGKERLRAALLDYGVAPQEIDLIIGLADKFRVPPGGATQESPQDHDQHQSANRRHESAPSGKRPRQPAS